MGTGGSWSESKYTDNMVFTDASKKKAYQRVYNKAYHQKRYADPIEKQKIYNKMKNIAMTPINSFERRMRFLFGLAFAVLFSTITISIFIIGKLKESGDWVAHTHEVIAAVNDVHVSFGDARVGTKNYLLTHKARHMAPRVNAFLKIDEGMTHIKTLTFDNVIQRQQVQETNLAIKEYYDLTSKMIVDIDNNRDLTPNIFAGWMDKTEPAGHNVSYCFLKLKAEEERLLIIRQQQSSSFVTQAYSVMPFMLVVQVLITTYLYYGVVNQCQSV